MMRKLLPTLFCCSLMFTLSAQVWEELEPYPGSPRHHPVVFSIGSKGYVTAGSQDPDAGAEPYLNDMMEFDSDSNTWRKLADFPGPPRGFAVGASHLGFGFMGFGVTSGNIGLNDLWRFDPASNSWTELRPCPCDARTHPAFVAAQGKIYVGQGGGGGNKNDWWEYDISSDRWEQRDNVPGVTRHHPYYFEVNGIAYTAFGHSNDDIEQDVFAFDPQTRMWEIKNDFPRPNSGKVAGSHFSRKGKGYILAGDGDNHGYLEGEFWEYDPDADDWTQMETFPADGRWAPGAFVIDDRAFFTSGLARNTSEWHNDFWSYTFEDISTSNDEVEDAVLNVYPNPGSMDFVLEGLDPGSLSVYDMQGKEFHFELVFDAKVQVNTSSWPSGIYSLVYRTDLGQSRAKWSKE